MSRRPQIGDFPLRARVAPVLVRRLRSLLLACATRARTLPSWQTRGTHRGPGRLSPRWRSSCRGKRSASSSERSWPAPAPCEKNATAVTQGHMCICRCVGCTPGSRKAAVHLQIMLCGQKSVHGFCSHVAFIFWWHLWGTITFLATAFRKHWISTNLEARTFLFWGFTKATSCFVTCVLRPWSRLWHHNYIYVIINITWQGKALRIHDYWINNARISFSFKATVSRCQYSLMCLTSVLSQSHTCALLCSSACMCGRHYNTPDAPPLYSSTHPSNPLMLRQVKTLIRLHTAELAVEILNGEHITAMQQVKSWQERAKRDGDWRVQTENVRLNTDRLQMSLQCGPTEYMWGNPFWCIIPNISTYSLSIKQSAGSTAALLHQKKNKKNNRCLTHVFYEADFILRLTDFQEWTPRVGEGTPCQPDTMLREFSLACMYCHWRHLIAGKILSEFVLLYKQELKPPLWSLHTVVALLSDYSCCLFKASCGHTWGINKSFGVFPSLAALRGSGHCSHRYIQQRKRVWGGNNNWQSPPQEEKRLMPFRTRGGCFN